MQSDSFRPLVRNLLVFIVLFAIAIPAHAAWKGARLIHLEHASELKDQPIGQIPIIAHYAVQPQFDVQQGLVWLATRSGSVEQYVPNLGKTRHWELPEGLDSSVLTHKGKFYIVSSNGTLYRLEEDQKFTELGSGFPSGYGVPCGTSSGEMYWQDTLGGVFSISADGKLFQRFSASLYRKKIIRGGSAIKCSKDSAFVAIAGGKLVKLNGNEIRWVQSPSILQGLDFASNTILTDKYWLICARSSVCVAIDLKDGTVQYEFSFSSQDGFVQIDSNHAAVASGSSVHIIDLDSFDTVRSISVAPEVSWIVQPDMGVMQESQLVWLITSKGKLYRINILDAESKVVYQVKSGVSSSGVLLDQGQAIIVSNYGTIHQFVLQ